MGGLAVVGGGSIRGVPIEAGAGALVQRHGDPYRLPHEIDHPASMRRLADAGRDRVLAIGSVGGLRPSWARGRSSVPTTSSPSTPLP